MVYKNIILTTLLTIFFFVGYGQNYFNNFKNSYNGFGGPEGNDINTCMINGSGVQIKNEKHTIAIFTTPLPIASDKDFEIKAEFIQTNGSPNEGIGIVWGADGWANSRVFLISKTGCFCTGFYRNGKYEPLKNWTKNQFINRNGANLLVVKKTAQKTDFFINGNKVFTSKAMHLFGPNHGLALKKDVVAVATKLEINIYKKNIDYIAAKSPTQKTRLNQNINSNASEIAPILSSDQQTLYFARINHPQNHGDVNDCDIWTSKIIDGQPQKAINIGSQLNNTGINVVFDASEDQNIIYLEGAYKKDASNLNNNGISYSKRLPNNTWSTPNTIKINGFYNHSIHSAYAFSPGKDVLVCSLERNDGYGMLDLHVCFLQSDGSYSEPQNMGLILNTFEDDGTPFIANDNKTLYFSSKGHNGFGSSDIFVSRRLDDTWLNWSEPQNLGPQINTKGWDSYFSVANDGKTAFFVSTNENNYNEDIYTIILPEEIQPSQNAIIEGIVTNDNTHKPIAATITCYEANTGKTIATTMSSALSGKYKIAVSPSTKYILHAEATGYLPQPENITSKGINTIVSQNLSMFPIQPGEKIVLRNVLFDRASSNLLDKSLPELNRFAALMVKYPNIKVEIDGYTDNNGNPDELLQLSQNRADAVKNYLIKKGISPNRLQSRGLGSLNPIYTGTSDTERMKNRRVEIKIIQ